jgi:hypothetical protein
LGNWPGWTSQEALVPEAWGAPAEEKGITQLCRLLALSAIAAVDARHGRNRGIFGLRFLMAGGVREDGP